MRGYNKAENINNEPLILESEDWTEEEYATLRKVFGCPEGTTRIKVTYDTVEYYVEGGFDKNNIDPEDYTIEYCPYCEKEQVIFSRGITKCPDCGKPLAPCSVCEECVVDCPYGCDGTENDEHKPVTNREITQEEKEILYKLL